MKNLTTQEAAEALRVHPKTLARWRKNNTGPTYVRAGRRILYPESAVAHWLNSHKAA